MRSDRNPLRRPQRARPAVREAPTEASQKLQKILAQAGLGSRRAMEQWIEEGRVTVNHKVAGIGTRVTPQDVIRVGQRVVHWPREPRMPQILIYHKPEGEMTSRDDPEGRPTVFDRLPRVHDGRWLAIGRLDYNTGGLLLFTTSGEVANRMMHPRYALEREYAVRTLGQLTARHIETLVTGVQLDDGPARCLTVEDAGGEGANHWYRIVLTEGRNRVVRRMFAALGFTVSRLMRVRFGPVRLPPQLKRGQMCRLDAAGVRGLLRALDGAPESAAATAPE